MPPTHFLHTRKRPQRRVVTSGSGVPFTAPFFYCPVSGASGAGSSQP